MTISKTSEIKANTRVYVVNGAWAGYFIEDCVTGNLVLFIPTPHNNGKTVRTFEQSSTYEGLFPSEGYDVHISDTDEKMFSNLPFEIGAYATDENSIYEVIGSSNNKSLVTVGPIELVKVKVKDLVTDEILIKGVSEIHVHEYNEEFNDDLIELTNSSNLAVKAYLKATYTYSQNFRQMIDHAKGILSLNDDTEFLSLIKDVCESSSSNILNTRGEYFVNGDDIQFYTFIEEDKIVTCKFKYQREDGAMILLNRNVRTVKEYRKLIEPILDKYKISLRGAIQILHEPYGILRTRNSRPYREPDSVELEECEIFEKQPDGKWS
jgi:hypothetical protein